MNQRSVRVLRDGENRAITLLTWLTVPTIVVTMLHAIRMFVILDMNCMTVGRGGKLLKEMVDPVRR